MTSQARLTSVLLLNLALVAGLVTVGFEASSVGVLAEGGDYLADSGAIGVSLLALWLSRRPGGHPKATAIAALINGAWLFLLSVGVAAAAARRLAGPAHHLHGLPVLVVSGIAAMVMLAGAAILKGDDSSDLNMRAVLLDTAADAAAAAGVAVTGGIIFATGRFYWLDPAVALIIAVVIGYHAAALLREVAAELRRAPLP